MKKTINSIMTWAIVLLFGSTVLGFWLWILGFIWIGAIELWSAIL